MAKTTGEVLLGPGTMYTAPEGEAFPADPTTAVAGNWEDIGYSEDGWNIVADLTYEFFTPAEEVDPIATLKAGQEMHVRGVAVQFSLENLQLARRRHDRNGRRSPVDQDVHGSVDDRLRHVRGALPHEGSRACGRRRQLSRRQGPEGRVRVVDRHTPHQGRQPVRDRTRLQGAEAHGRRPL